MEDRPRPWGNDSCLIGAIRGSILCGNLRVIPSGVEAVRIAGVWGTQLLASGME
ncbi:hypothetical protein QQ054_30730 [Oscillatoria amoena NRMC-F 0135]|nr:hypothetical protein [Oscillatoria amoena NRMC-F 0135]